LCQRHSCCLRVLQQERQAKLKLFLVGTFLTGRIEISLEKALRNLPCQIRRFNIRETNRLMLPVAEYLINKKIYKAVKDFNPDLVLVVKGYYLLPQTIKKIKESSSSLIFCFNTDNPFNLSSRGANNSNIVASIPHYDCYFIWSRSLIGPLRKLGAKRVEYLPFGFDPDWHNLVNLSEAQRHLYANDITFVGNWDRERESWLKNVQDFDLGIWGERYWNRRCHNSALRKKWRRRPAYAQDMAKVLAASKVSLNILRAQNKGAHNMRTFEAPACGAFALAERSAEAEEFFTEGKEAVYFSTPAELREKARYYLNNEEERKKISQAGYLRCLKSNYSYFYRARDIINCYGDFIEQGRGS